MTRADLYAIGGFCLFSLGFVLRVLGYVQAYEAYISIAGLALNVCGAVLVYLAVRKPNGTKPKLKTKNIIYSILGVLFVLGSGAAFIIATLLIRVGSEDRQLIMAMIPAYFACFVAAIPFIILSRKDY